ncbi:MAG: hypothetical protein K2Q14_06860 [Gammaproteobacteria bacterium]|nr:hypothetical protein [Gammaproteobacteria bacterium]
MQQPTDLIALLANISQGQVKDIDLGKIYKLAREKAPFNAFRGHTKDVEALAVLSDGLLVSGSKDHTIMLWNLTPLSRVEFSKAHQNKVSILLAVPGKSLLFSGSSDHTIKLWDTNTYRSLAHLQGHTGVITSLAILSDGRLVSGSNDNTLKLWDIEHASYSDFPQEHSGAIGALLALENGLLVSGSSGDKRIKLWKIEADNTINCIKIFEEAHAKPINDLMLLPNGYLASKSDDNRIKLWNIESGQCITEFQDEQEGLGALVTARWMGRSNAMSASASSGARRIAIFQDGLVASSFNEENCSAYPIGLTCFQPIQIYKTTTVNLSRLDIAEILTALVNLHPSELRTLSLKGIALSNEDHVLLLELIKKSPSLIDINLQDTGLSEFQQKDILDALEFQQKQTTVAGKEIEAIKKQMNALNHGVVQLETMLKSQGECLEKLTHQEASCQIELSNVQHKLDKTQQTLLDLQYPANDKMSDVLVAGLRQMNTTLHHIIQRLEKLESNTVMIEQEENTKLQMMEITQELFDHHLQTAISNQDSVRVNQLLSAQKRSKVTKEMLSIAYKQNHPEITSIIETHYLKDLLLELKPTQWPSDYAYALLSEQAYRSDLKPGERVIIRRENGYIERLLESNWRVYNTYQDSKTGYFSALFINAQDKHLVLAHRGTDFEIYDLLWGTHDIEADIALVDNRLPKQTKNVLDATYQALELVHKYGYHLSITGHSLGAWAGTASSYLLIKDQYYQRVHTVLFDPPGFLSAEESSELESVFHQADMTFYFGPPNSINTLNTHHAAITKFRLYPSLECPSIFEALRGFFPLTRDYIRAASGHKIVKLVNEFNKTTGMPFDRDVILQWPNVEKSNRSDAASFITALIGTAVVYVATAGVLLRSPYIASFRGYLMVARTMATVLLAVTAYYFPFIYRGFEYFWGKMNTSKLDSFLRDASADLKLNLTQNMNAINRREFLKSTHYEITAYRSHRAKITYDLKWFEMLLTKMLDNQASPCVKNAGIKGYFEADSRSAYWEFKNSTWTMENFFSNITDTLMATFNDETICDATQRKQALEELSAIYVDKQSHIDNESTRIINNDATSSASRLMPLQHVFLQQLLFYLNAIYGALTPTWSTQMPLEREMISHSLSSSLQDKAWMIQETLSNHSTDGDSLVPSLLNLNVYWYSVPLYTLHPQTGVPVFTVGAWQNDVPVGYVKLYGTSQFCRSRSGLRHNIVELGGVLKGQESAIQPEVDTPVCEALPPTESSFGEQLGQSATHGFIAGMSNLLKRGLQQAGASPAIATVTAQTIYYASLFALGYTRHYAAISEADVPEEEAVLQAATQAATETATVLAVQTVSHSLQYVGNTLNDYQWKRTGKVCKVIGSVFSATRYAPCFFRAYQQPDVISAASSLAQTAGAIGVGIVTQPATDPLGSLIT